MADVEATIFLCRLIADKAPEIWSAFMRFSQKAAVADHIVDERIVSLSDFYFGKPYSWLVTMIGTNPEIGSEFFVYNLAIPPEELSNLAPDELVVRLDKLPKPVRRVRSNACPMIMMLEDAPAICSARELGMAELNRRADFIHTDHSFRQRIVDAFRATKAAREPSPHVEQQLYDGFFPKEDEALMQRFHLVAWEERLPLVRAFKDDRLRKIGLQLVHLERPGLLPDAECASYDRAAAIRVTGHEAEYPWLTLPRALAELDELLAGVEPIYVGFLHEHRSHLSERLERAKHILGL
jgi:exodeoxyribonuclease-1